MKAMFLTLAMAAIAMQGCTTGLPTVPRQVLTHQKSVAVFQYLLTEKPTQYMVVGLYTPGQYALGPSNYVPRSTEDAWALSKVFPSTRFIPLEHEQLLPALVFARGKTIPTCSLIIDEVVVSGSSFAVVRASRHDGSNVLRRTFELDKTNGFWKVKGVKDK